MKIPVKPDRRSIRLSGDAVPGMHVREHPEKKHTTKISLSPELVDASIWVNEGLTEFKTSARASEKIGDRWETHADKKIIDQWLADLGANDDDRVIYFVAAHVLAEWWAIPARTVKDHRKLYREIDETAMRLVALLAATEEVYYRGGGHGLRDARVSDLFTEPENQEIVDVVDAWNEEHPTDEWGDGDIAIKPARACFPSMEELLERIASAARRLSVAGPLHSQPNKKGALNGYFIRRMDGLLVRRYGKYPAEVLASIASIVLDAVIDADLVKKTVSLRERFGKKTA